MITVLVDDLRSFADGREAIVYRDPWKAVNDIARCDRIDELWLDHDMGPGITIQPVIFLLCDTGRARLQRRIGKVWVHTSNPPAGERMVATLRDAGYNVERFWESFLAEPMWKYVPLN